MERAQARGESDVVRAHAEIDTPLAPLMMWWRDWDQLVTPTIFQPAWLLGSNSGLVQMGTLLAPFSPSGQPTLSLPMHWGSDDLPIGTQLVGAQGKDENLLVWPRGATD
jgi:amidase